VQADQTAIHGLTSRLQNGVRRRLRELRLKTQSAHTHLQALNPEATLRRGFAICQRTATGEIVFAPAEVEPDERLSIRVRDGTFAARVTGTTTESEQDSRGAQ
jgi:exonuclease VII large subunit